MTADLWGNKRRRRARRRRAGPLVPVPIDSCPACGEPTRDDTVRADALLRHGGFGATIRTTRRACLRCPWALSLEIAEERPPR